MPTTAIYEVAFVGTLNGVPVRNTLHFETGSTECNFIEAGELGGQLITVGIVGDFLDCCPNEYILESLNIRGIVVPNIDGPGHIPLRGSISPVATATFVIAEGLGAGTRTGDITANAAGPMSSFFPKLNPGERARVCKVYFPGITESDGEKNLVSSDIRSNMRIFLDALGAGFPITSGSVVWKALIALTQTIDDVVSHRTDWRQIVGSAVEYFIAQQRRRMPPH